VLLISSIENNSVNDKFKMESTISELCFLMAQSDNENTILVDSTGCAI